MGQRQCHRGRHPEDQRLFCAKWIPLLRAATSDVSYLLSRGYASRAALKLVGDHFQLDARQRSAIDRASCADESFEYRCARHISPESLSGQDVVIDGYNLLITMECALSGGVLLLCRDGCLRDIASVHGSYHRVEETLPAIHAIGAVLERLRVGTAQWYFDAPVSNSGRLKALVLEEARSHAWSWTAEVAANPDKILASSDCVVVSSDSWVLDNVQRWTNLAGLAVAQIECNALLVDLGSTES